MEEPQGVFSKGVLIFQGKQSIGKTSWFKKLLPSPVSEYFLEGATLDPTNKDSKATVTSHALVELGEADSTMRKDIAAIKAFLTSNKDVFRPSYGRVDSKLPRRTIFCASVNDNEYLVDPTGNSRFWTIPVTALDYKHEIDMQQFWAQILTYYDAGEIWWLQQEDEKILNKYNEEHVKTCPYTELLTARYLFPEKNDQDPENQRYSATDIYRSLDMKLNERVGAIEVARALTNLGAYRLTDDRKFLVKHNPDYKPVNSTSELFKEE
jgi:putative DNA primase/helicase